MKVMLLLKRKAGMSAAEFQEYYERSHVALAHKYLGHLFADYRRNYMLPVEGGQGESQNPGLANPDYDAVTEIWMKDEAAWAEMQRIMADPEIGRIFMEDEEHFLDRPALRIFPCFEVKSATIPA